MKHSFREWIHVVPHCSDSTAFSSPYSFCNWWAENVIFPEVGGGLHWEQQYLCSDRVVVCKALRHFSWFLEINAAGNEVWGKQLHWLLKLQINDPDLGSHNLWVLGPQYLFLMGSKSNSYRREILSNIHQSDFHLWLSIGIISVIFLDSTILCVAPPELLSISLRQDPGSMIS